MQTVGPFQTFENYLFLPRLMCTVQEGVGGGEAGPGTITGVETMAEAQHGPRDSQHTYMQEGGGIAFSGGCLSRWRGLVMLSTLESWIRPSSCTRQFEQHLHTYSVSERRQDK